MLRRPFDLNRACIGAVRSTKDFHQGAFPAPFSPSKANTSPAFKVRLTPRNACTPGNDFTMPRISSSGGVWGIEEARSEAVIVLKPVSKPAA